MSKSMKLEFSSMLNDQLIEERFRELDDKIKKLSVADVPDHRHNGFDSSQLYSKDIKFPDLYVKRTIKTVAAGGDIQNAIDTLNAEGGGEVRLSAGTHFATTDIDVKSNVTLVGAGVGVTVIDFNGGSLEVRLLGDSRTVTGTATATEGSKTVTTTGSFGAAVAGDSFYVTDADMGFYAEIASVESTTSLTLVEVWSMPTVATTSYDIFLLVKNSGVKNMTIKRSSSFNGGLRVWFVTNCVFENLVVSNNTSIPVITGIDIEGVFDSEFRNVESSYNRLAGFRAAIVKRTSFYNCSAKGNNSDGFNFYNTDANECSLYSCVADGNGGDGYESTGDKIRFVSCRANGNDANGFKLTTGGLSSNSSLWGCQAVDNGSDGIEVDRDFCVIQDCYLAENDAYGINVTSNADNTKIQNCRFSNNATAPILDGGTNTTYLNSDAGTFTAANGANNNIDIDEMRFVRITGPTGAFSISGIAGGINGMEVYLYNAVAFDFTITNDATSTAANRILTLTGADVTLTGVSVAHLVYNGTDARWILLGTQG